MLRGFSPAVGLWLTTLFMNDGDGNNSFSRVIVFARDLKADISTLNNEVFFTLEHPASSKDDISCCLFGLKQNDTVAKSGPVSAECWFRNRHTNDL